MPDEKQFNLSSKILTFNGEKWIPQKKVKEKIQNAQRRLKGELSWQGCHEIINKIFKEEFGDKLT